MTFEERALRFDCNGCSLVGIVSLPSQPSPRGVLIVVGGPQYRAGSHRQFTLQARRLAAAGVPAMRFDYRGMGDSEGDARSFGEIEDDIRCAIDNFIEAVPGLKEVVIWGLCDAASAASFYAASDVRVSGLVLLNPWIRTEEGIARTYLKHYYIRRLFDPDLWKKIARLKFGYRQAAASLMASVRKVSGTKKEKSTGDPALPDRMLDGLGRFSGKVLVILAGGDLTANEFAGHVKASRPWKKWMSSRQVERRMLPHANHTFSRHEWREQVAEWTEKWIRSW